jgi:glycosyltransferase involved in cell wall biosynthesis
VAPVAYQTVFISVIICTFNPRRDYLARTLNAIAGQTFAAENWELLVVDNRSEPPLTSEIFAILPKHGRIVREENLGLTPARLCGIRESRGELLVFADDDNELATDYLEIASNLAAEHPDVGVFSANIRPEYETPPPVGSSHFEPYLAIRELDMDVIGKTSMPQVGPIGAGMVVRRAVAVAYAAGLGRDPGRLRLDRKGDGLLAGGDSDIGYEAFDLGFACGAFHRLKLTHLIPTRRLQWHYLEKLAEDVTYSHLLLARFRGAPPVPFSRRVKFTLGLLAMHFHPNRPYGRWRRAQLRAKIRAAAVRV